MTHLRWIPSVPASAFHAASAILESRSLTNPALQKALSEPVGRMNNAVPGTASWMNRDSSEADAARAILDAFNRAVPTAARELELRVAPLREQWEARGPGLLHRVGKLTEPGLIAQSADVVLLYPALGGGGRVIRTSPGAVAIEAVLANPLPELPEVVRLGWLLAQLEFCGHPTSTQFAPDRLAEVGPLAILPAVLAVAEDLELIRSAEAALPRAIEAWHLGPADSAVIADWWQRYQAEKPAWGAAVENLDGRLA